MPIRLFSETPNKVILLIDDSAVQRRMTIEMIRQAGYGHYVLEASDAKEGIDLLQQNLDRLALVICDWNMPSASGLEVFKALSSLAFSRLLPALVVATGMKEGAFEKIKGIYPQIAGVLEKPFTPQELRDSLKTALGES